MADSWEVAVERLIRLGRALQLPETSEGTSYGTPALLVKGKAFARLKDAETLVLHCPPEQKDLLMEMAPEVYFETDHYKGWAAVLIRLAAIPDAELSQRLADGWRHRAPKRLAAEAIRSGENGRQGVCRPGQ